MNIDNVSKRISVLQAKSLRAQFPQQSYLIDSITINGVSVPALARTLKPKTVSEKFHVVKNYKYKCHNESTIEND